MKTKIIDLLNCTEHQYEMLVFDHFMLWCNLHSYSEADLQHIIANSKIEQWFQKEYQKHQIKFVQLVQNYKGYCNTQDMERIYNQEVSKVKDFFPKSLIRKVRRKNYSIYGNLPNTN